MPQSDFGPRERFELRTGKQWTPKNIEVDEGVDIVDTIRAGVKVAIVRSQLAIDRYFRRGQLGAASEAKDLYRTAELYRSRWLLAFGPGIRAQALQERITGVKKTEMTEGQVAAIRSIRMADAIVGPTQASCLRHVCGMDWSADAWARNHGGYKRSGIGITFLVDALRLLSRGGWC